MKMHELLLQMPVRHLHVHASLYFELVEKNVLSQETVSFNFGQVMTMQQSLNFLNLYMSLAILYRVA